MTLAWFLLLGLLSTVSLAQGDTDCAATRLHLSEPPYENYFLSDCHSSSHVIVTNPNGNSTVSPRLLVAWPAGNSGVCAIFAPESGNSSLGLHIENSTTTGEALDPTNSSGGSEDPNPRVGVSGLLHFDSPAILTVPILGSIRNIRDYTEGGGYLNPVIQNAVQTIKNDNKGATVYRTWLDKTTTTWLDFEQTGSADACQIIPGDTYTIRFGTGTYKFSASFNYPQLEQLSPQEVLSPAAQGLIAEYPDQTTSLSFLSYTDKLLAGTWRFLTYFGRDSMITALLMQSVLSEGEGGAIEAVISAVLERISMADGTVCHEEVIGDFATLLNQANGINSTAPSCDYKMVDTDYYLPVLMKSYFIDSTAGAARTGDFLGRKASFLPRNAGISYQTLAQATAEKIMRTSAAFASDPKIENLISLNDGQSVGEWRDSNNGLGGGRVPYDVNTALVPAGLRAIGALARAGLFQGHDDWSQLADEYAQVWEDETLQFFHVSIPQDQARNLVTNYVSASGFTGPSNVDRIVGDVNFYGLALGGENNQYIIQTMNTDDCFRHFLLNTTNQTQLSAYLEQTVDNILAPFPVGLSSDVGLFVANPAYGPDASYAANFKNSDYHGTVVWSWQLAMMAAGLNRQLDRCNAGEAPDFCDDSELHDKIVSAYDHLWDLIDANQALLSGEVWSWKYDNGFQAVPFSAFSSTESDIRQLWSLTFLAIRRQST